MNGDTRVRVYNKCHYDIGVNLINGIGINIRTGSFQIMTVDDVLFIESICGERKFFSQKMLVAVDNQGKEIPFEEIGLYVEDKTNVHLQDDEIKAELKKSAKNIGEWLDTITDVTELHSIYLIAKKIDLPASKIKILKEKIPNKEWFEE